MRKTLTISAVSFLACFAANSIFASGVPCDNLEAFKLRPELNAWGFTGDHLVGFGQGMVPFFGDQSQVLYGLGEGKIAKSASGWLVGAGIGYRKIYQDVLWGGYALLNYNRTPMENHFWVANPGLEALTTNWDFRVNGYFPFAKKNWESSQLQTVFASDIGNYNYASFQGHSKFDSLVDVGTITREQAGLGFDGEVGRNIPGIKNLKAFVGGYYYNTSDLGNVGGGEARLTYQVFDWLGLEGRDTYDNYKKNTAMIGIKLTIGGFNCAEKDQFGLSGRLLDPIEHNFATIGAGYAVPVRSEVNANLQSFHNPNTLVGNNFWFFEPLSASNFDGDGTFENPYIGFEQAMVDNIKAVDPNGANLYFAPGAYSLAAFTSPVSPGYFDVPVNFMIYGRTANYVAPAVGDNRALFIGGMSFLSGHNLLDSVRFENYIGAPLLSAIFSNICSDISFNNVQIGLPGEVGGSYPAGVHSILTHDLNFNDSQIYALSQGIVADNSTVNLYNNNLIDVESSLAFGIYIANSNLNLIGDNNRIMGASGSTAYGIYAAGFDDIIISGNNNIIQATSDLGSIGIYAGDSSINISGDSNQIFATSNDGSAYGIQSLEANINISGCNNSIFANSINGIAFGIYDVTQSKVDVSGNNNTIHAEAGDISYGVYLSGNSTFAITGQNNNVEALGLIGGSVNQSEAYGVYFADIATNFLNISGNGNTIKADAADSAVGIWRDDGTTNVIKITGQTNIDVGLNSDPVKAYGIYINNSNPVQINAGNFDVRNTTFNIQQGDGGGWGIAALSGLNSEVVNQILISHNVFKGDALNNSIDSTSHPF